MSWENELKFILDPEDYGGFFHQLAPQMQSIFLIDQGYLTDNARLRRRVKYDTEGHNKVEYFFTFKFPLRDKVHEIEKKIDEQEFRDLWDETTRRVAKRRLVIRHGELDWEIDFLHNHAKKDYIIVAEVEMPDGMEEPPELPGFVREHLLYAVPRGDKRFTNSKIADYDYAVHLIEELRSNNEGCEYRRA